jgi:hypothetical protein
MQDAYVGRLRLPRHCEQDVATFSERLGLLSQHPLKQRSCSFRSFARFSHNSVLLDIHSILHTLLYLDIPFQHLFTCSRIVRARHFPKCVMRGDCRPRNSLSSVEL